LPPDLRLFGIARIRKAMKTSCKRIYDG